MLVIVENIITYDMSMCYLRIFWSYVRPCNHWQVSTWQTTDNAPHRQQLLADQAGGWSVVASLGWCCCCSTAEADGIWLVNAHDNQKVLSRGRTNHFSNIFSLLVVFAVWQPSHRLFIPHHWRLMFGHQACSVADVMARNSLKNSLLDPICTFDSFWHD